ncbi:MAG: response regulator transcription factor [bacterium]|nr:response regulator transcription factor [bacterium]
MTKSSKVFSILLVDDHPIMRDGIAQVIRQQPDMEVCGEAGSASEALKILANGLPDLAIIDISLKDISGIELIKEIKGRFKPFPILVLSMHPESLYAERAIRAGARGYVQKDESAEKLLKAIRRTMKGKIYLSPEMSEKLLDTLLGDNQKNTGPLTERLSDRELEVFRLLGNGLKPRQMAEKLFLSVKTIETYCLRLRQKLNAGNASELLQMAIKWCKEEGRV